MKKSTLSILALLFLPTQVNSGLTQNCHKIKVAVVDTGLDLKDPRFKNHLCPTGHKNFVPGKTIDDNHGHGTHVSGLIEQFAYGSNYCLLIYKYYSESATGQQNLDREILSFQEAINNGADIVNFSGGGPEFNELEYLIIKNHPKVTFVVAAGNEHQNLDVHGNEYYPASYFLPNELVVSANDHEGFRMSFSNYGSKVTDSELGEDVLSFLPGNRMGKLSGSSQATAIKSGKLVDKMSKMCNY